MRSYFLFFGVLCWALYLLSAQYEEDYYDNDYSFEDPDHPIEIERRSADEKKKHSKDNPNSFLYDLYPQYAMHRMSIVSGHRPCSKVGQVCWYQNRTCCGTMKCDCVTEIITLIDFKCLCVDR